MSHDHTQVIVNTYSNDLCWQSAVGSCDELVTIRLKPVYFNIPVSAEVVKIVGRLKRLPSAAWPRMFCLNTAGS
jgi:hypothetical protein